MAFRVGQAIKELRIHLCQTSKSSAGVREFIEKQYVTIKKNNPHFPILIRECNGIEPVIWARYGKGEETSASLKNQTADQVSSTFSKLV